MFLANDALPTAVPWLLIFDNADSEDKDQLLKEFWPSGDYGSILITSRDISLQTSVGGRVLSELAEESAVGLLLRLTKPQWSETSEEIPSHEEEAAHRIVSNLRCLPLGITQAAKVIINDQSLLSDFLDAYNDRELIESSGHITTFKKPGSQYSLNLSTVWNMSFETLEKEQKTFLNVISFLDPDRIQLQLLSEGAAKAVRIGKHALSFMDNIHKLNKCKGPVVRSSLVTQNENLRELWMHRLVQQACHMRMDPEVRQTSFDMAYWMVKTMWPVPAREDRHRKDLWATQQAYFAHVQSLAHFYHTSLDDNIPLTAGRDFAELLTDASL